MPLRIYSLAAIKKAVERNKNSQGHFTNSSQRQISQVAIK